MKIAIIGATGFVGKQLVAEALERGHQVKAIARSAVDRTDPNLEPVPVDVTDTAALAVALKGSDVVLSAYNAGWTNPELYHDFITGSKAIQQATKEAGVRRLIVVGGGGSLYIAAGLQLVDTPDFPEAYKAGAMAARGLSEPAEGRAGAGLDFFQPGD